MKKRTYRKGISCLLVAAMLMGLCSFSPMAYDDYIGDVNLDKHVNSSDARLMMRTLVSEDSFSDETAQLADINGDGAHDTSDARGIMEIGAQLRAELIPLSGFTDSVDGSGQCTYRMRAAYTDTYTFACSLSSSITVETARGAVSGTVSVSKHIIAGEICTITVKARPGTRITLTVTAKEHYQRLPYDAEFTVDPDTLDTIGDPSVDPLGYAEISYSKREGGTYIYANNPEKLQSADIGQALLRTKALTGDVEFTYEHSNFTGRSIYLGYQLKNTSTSDVYVTVTNIGMQVQGEWLGQQSWSDYYNYKFELPEDYFDAYGNESSRYEGQDFIDYTPRAYQPMTYRIPAGKYIYVLGGTTNDAYNNINVASTANKTIGTGRCSNGVVKFHVTGGEVTGTFYCYTNTSQVEAEPAEQGYVVDRDGTSFGLQYKGVDYHQGLVESNMIWYVNDKTADGNLPVTYTSNYDRNAYKKHDPYEEYNSTTNRVRYQNYWITHINPQNTNSGIGSDMMSFECVTTDGKTVTIDTQRADAYGTAANLGNWMVDYHDNMTFVNQGDTTRYFTINKYAGGALMAMVLDEEGEVLTTKCTIIPISESADERQWEIYTVEVPPHSVRQVTVSFLLMGNSYGNVRNWVTLD